MESKQFSAAIAAIREMGVLSGQRIERREIGAPGEFEALTDDELLAALRERLRALGLAPDAGSDTRH
jgi:Fe2+ transport system protein FeoA